MKTRRELLKTLDVKCECIYMIVFLLKMCLKDGPPLSLVRFHLQDFFFSLKAVSCLICLMFVTDFVSG